jgi:hypothetical protein
VSSARPTFDALIKLWRLVDGDTLTNPNGEEIFWRGAAKLGSLKANLGKLGEPPAEPDVPVLINHDKSRRIGVVRSLFGFDDLDGAWLCAACTITDAPSWLKRGTAASLCYQVVAANHGRMQRGYVPEVSVLVPGVAPFEARAKVMSFREAKPVIAREPEVSFGQGEMIRRPNIGRILQVGGEPIGRSTTPSSSLIRTIQRMPDDGYSTTYDHHGRVISRTRLTGRGR